MSIDTCKLLRKSVIANTLFMEQFQLSLLLKIIGLGSASGLIYSNNNLTLIGDNSGFLYDYNITTKKLSTHALIENAKANIEKKLKPDFEAIAKFENSYYIFGSGSTENRNIMLEVDAVSKKVNAKTDLSYFYESLQSFGNIKEKDFNIEGATFDGQNWYIANRGNGKKTKNIIFTVKGKSLDGEIQIVANKFKLPKLNDVKTSFTDIIKVNNKIYFLAAAEDTDSTFFDGEVMGTIIGCIDIKTMTIDFTHQISKTQKFEGLTVFEQTDDKITFLLCEDNDTTLLESNIYKLTLSK